ncbi:hypothetical protein C8T65DRAFT_743009 [Cerioporus squamosus]|nr:hypothetical protein C8T65DRAFT_743009 [Cerioporus squamosus]
MPGTYHPTLNEAVESAWAANITVVIFPALIRLDSMLHARLDFFCDIARERQKPCETCAAAGRDCVLHNASSYRCVACWVGARGCSHLDYMVARGYASGRNVQAADIAVHHDAEVGSDDEDAMVLQTDSETESVEGQVSEPTDDNDDGEVCEASEGCEGCEGSEDSEDSEDENSACEDSEDEDSEMQEGRKGKRRSHIPHCGSRCKHPKTKLAEVMRVLKEVRKHQKRIIKDQKKILAVLEKDGVLASNAHVARASNAHVAGASNAPIAGASNAHVARASNAPIAGASNAPIAVKEEKCLPMWWDDLPLGSRLQRSDAEQSPPGLGGQRLYPKMYHPTLKDAVEAAYARNINLTVFPALLRVKHFKDMEAIVKWLKDLSEVRADPCKPCKDAGRECMPHNGNSIRCLHCFLKEVAGRHAYVSL